MSTATTVCSGARAGGDRPPLQRNASHDLSLLTRDDLSDCLAHSSFLIGSASSSKPKRHRTRVQALTGQRLRADESQVTPHACRCDGATHPRAADIAHAPFAVTSLQDRERAVEAAHVARDQVRSRPRSRGRYHDLANVEAEPATDSHVRLVERYRDSRRLTLGGGTVRVRNGCDGERTQHHDRNSGKHPESNSREAGHEHQRIRLGRAATTRTRTPAPEQVEPQAGRHRLGVPQGSRHPEKLKPIVSDAPPRSPFFNAWPKGNVGRVI